MDKCITHNKLISYLKKLSEKYNVFFPVKVGEKISYTNDKAKISLFFPGLSHIPPKEFFLPAREEIAQFYEDGDVKLKPTNYKNINILFAAHPMDIKALTILEKLMQKNYPDFYWKRRKKNFYIIGLGDYTYADHFYCDVFLESNGDVYEVMLRNPDARSLLEFKNIFVPCVFKKDKVVYEEDPIFSDITKLANAVEGSYKSKIWDDLAKIDLMCGNCSFTCPLCYCFENFDNTRLSGPHSATRNRRWSSCFHVDFFEISGHNFRPQKRDRIYNWYHHKFVRFPREIGHVGCVDCGRCTRYCPAKINYKHVLKSVLDEYAK